VVCTDVVLALPLPSGVALLAPSQKTSAAMVPLRSLPDMLARIDCSPFAATGGAT
jgi:hypothetical protein